MTRPAPPRRWLLVLAATLGLVLPIALRALLRPDLDVYDARDEDLFHLPTVQGFAAALPTPDLSDYPSATGPLYHLLLAPLAALTGGDLLVLRLATLALASGGLAFGAALLARRSVAPAWGLVLLLLPVGLSPYFLGPAVRLSTDDAALLWVVATLWALDRARGALPGLDLRGLAVAAALACAAVWTRQVHGWLVGLLAVLPLVATGAPPGRRLAGLALAGLPILALAPLVLLWGGLTPPSFAEHQGGLNPAVLQTELAVLGALGLAHAPWLLGALERAGLGGARGLLLAGACLLLGAALLLLFPLPFVEDPLRYGGSLWRLSSRLPDVAGSTLAFWGLVPLGLAWLVAIAAEGKERRDPLPTAALLLFLVANVASARAYQKYYEPFLLLVLGWVVARSPAPGRWAWAGPAALSLAWLGVAALRFVR